MLERMERASGGPYALNIKHGVTHTPSLECWNMATGFLAANSHYPALVFDVPVIIMQYL